jgi:NifB/MoaA-like Fe-S oxidoreductase
LSEAAEEFAGETGCRVEVIPVANQRLGESITAAGLLMAGDIIDRLRQADLPELVVLPRVVFDHPDVVSLDDFSPQQVADELQRTVALADVMGDVWDACSGRSQLIYYPGSGPDRP